MTPAKRSLAADHPVARLLARDGTGIEWADLTFNPWKGCTKISPACDHCYAESWAKRIGSPELWQGERERTRVTNWKKPLRWNKIAGETGLTLSVFCASVADVFDNQVPSEWRDDLWALIRSTPHLRWKILTKRPQNIAKMLPPDWGDGYPNVAIGVTAENQIEADRRVPHLLTTPAALRFVSYEPALGPVDWTRLKAPGVTWMNALDGLVHAGPSVYRQFDQGLDLIIYGEESGSGRRPSDPAWEVQTRAQCDAAGVAYFRKQMWIDGKLVKLPVIDGTVRTDLPDGW